MEPETKTSNPLEHSTLGLGKRLWRDWISPYWPRLIVIAFLMLCVSAATASYPILIDWTYRLFEARDLRVVTLVPFAVIAVAMAKGLSMYLQTVATNRFVLRVIADIQKAMFTHLLNADLTRLMREPTGKLTSRFTNDVTALRDALLRTITGFVRDFFTLISLIATMFYLDWMLSIIVLFVLPLGALPVSRIGKRMRRVSMNMQSFMGDLTSLLNESLSGVRMVKTYRLEAYERARADKQFDIMYGWLLALVKGRARVEPILESLGGIAVAGVIAFAGWRMIYGQSTIGEFTGFVAALLIAAQPLRSLGQLNVALQEGLATLARVFTLLDEAPQIVDQNHATPLKLTGGSLHLQHVSFSYGVDLANALEDVCLTAEKGKVTALVGPSGAGKSTVINLIPRFFEAQKGQVSIDGQDVRDVTLASLRDAMSLVTQDVILFNDTVRANIAFGKPGADENAIIGAAKAAAAHDFIMSFPHGYDTEVGERGLNLSGGQRQRIALARAMVRNAPILLLDEATSALDAESEKQIQDALERLMAGRTTLVIAHRLATVRGADQIYVMDNGKVAEEGNHASLLAQDGVYARLCKLQFFGPEE